MRYSNYIAALALSALLWTGAGESSDPELKTAELPADVLNDCTTVTMSAARPPCSSANYRSRWIGRAARWTSGGRSSSRTCGPRLRIAA